MTDVSIPSVTDAALAYIRRGWAIIPVYGLTEAGACMCRTACGTNAGKHPAQREWTKLPKYGNADAMALFDPDSGGSARLNVGIRTGVVSGIWCLDVDPKNGGDASLLGLIAEHGPLPRTWAGRTGSGGTHYVFRMPADLPIRNARGRLPVGLDVRGDGGMIVAAPSVSGIGPYSIIDDSDPADAPQWLIDLICADVHANTADSPVVENLPRTDELDPAEARRVQKYAEAAVLGEAARYESATSGTGNQSLFQACCSIIEFVQSPWNTITHAQAVRVLDAARQRRLTARPGGGQSAEELEITYNSALKRVVGKGRPLPPDRSEGMILDIPFEQSPVTAGGGGDQDDSDSFVLDVDDDAPSRSFLEILRDSLLTADEVAARPNPVPLINGVLDLDSEAWVIGAPGSFKSFVALDMAGHVGTGKAYHGRSVHQGNVLYLVAEGVTGMTLRVRAWQEKYGPMSHVTFIPFAVQAGNDEQWRALLTVARELKPVLVIIDTQARVTVGMEENGATEMGRYIDAVSRLRRVTGACVCTIHHTGRDGINARGSSAIDGAQGTELKVERPDAKGMTVRLLMDKQKDMADTDSIEILLEKVDQGLDPETGRDLSSLVAVEASPFSEIDAPPWINELRGNQFQIAETLYRSADERGLTTTDIRLAIKDKYGEMRRSSFNEALAALKIQSIVTNGTRGDAHWTLSMVRDNPDLALPGVPRTPGTEFDRYRDPEAV